LTEVSAEEGGEQELNAAFEPVHLHRPQPLGKIRFRISISHMYQNVTDLKQAFGRRRCCFSDDSIPFGDVMPHRGLQDGALRSCHGWCRNDESCAPVRIGAHQ
jgi:hypothetical protein